MSITTQQALDCFASDDLIGIGMEADALRRSLHPENVVTYLLDDPSDPATTATLTLSGQSPAQTLAQLEAIRLQQTQTSAFAAFTLQTTAEPTAVEYLKTLAIARLYLDNIPNIQTSVHIGPKVLQMALRFGANDIGPLDPTSRTTEEDLRRIIRDAGFHPVQRDPTYRTLLLN